MTRPATDPRVTKSPRQAGARAPAAPGAVARWANAEKSAIGTAIAESSAVWFSMAEGVLTEVFHPAPDRACIRSLAFVVTGDGGFVSDEASETRHEQGEPRGPAPVATTFNTCQQGRYRIEKETLCAPDSAVVLQRVRFVPLQGKASSYRLFCILEPHLGEEREWSTAELGEHKGVSTLLARSDDSGLSLALLCTAPWRDASVGFAGTASDGRRDLGAHGHLTQHHDRASSGNVVLVAEIDPRALELGFTLALGLGATTGDAAHAAHAVLLRGDDAVRAELVDAWEHWNAGLCACRVDGETPRLWTRSTTVLKSLEAKRASGGRVAALSTPWGASKGPGIDGTYHLVWTRDLVECLGALLAARAHDEVRAALRFLRSTQERDGHWPQNMRLSGEAFWNEDELDEVALPIVFLHLVERDGLISERELAACWPMVRDAADFLVRRGPSTTRDRWEDATGVTPFTMATEIVALLIAAEMAERRGIAATARGLRELADEWNEAVDTLLYRRGGALAEELGVDGYYIRVRTPGAPLARILDPKRLPTTELSPDALALVRFGLRAPDDPRIVATVRAIDAVLRTDFESGPAWRRYPGDAYGEHEDGAPFDGDGHGIGRPWPLLTGERAHYELACGRPARATSLLHTMESFANAGGMLPEQVWDRDDLPARGLVRGKPSGSAAPLGWAHAEYVKLCRSLADGAVFDMPALVRDRYVPRRR